MVAYNGTGAIADATYTVNLTITDGTTSLTDEVDINTAVALAGNITFTAADLATLAETGAGTVTYSLLNSTDAELDSYIWEDVTINANATSGALYAIIPIVVSLLAVTMVFGAIGGVFGKIGNMRIGGRKKK
jgi:hypothetical protein